ncbi:RNA-guided endonuclease InsQ/TnpB family protein [Cylindrospermum sp. FACHB-282]|uniref:RNA-guided endonuclease InsQ/TnpB family protein n=1 Tax=Cylindrospermum sp. FACHB-282 TaxID=2692794 RepID=UPI0016826E69|nr:RNA-guided endonuclease TnpB family protein [Cylindrospermum sp. FACHB-282]MBD2387645.1 IS200/IS605 family element transposase accessory protein TnpB [Cylindrospermum sp. FACHB-282]
MRQVEKHIIKYRHEWFDYCTDITTISRQLYNAAQFTQRQGFFYRWGTQTQGSLDTLFKQNQNYKSMPAKVAQLVLKQNADGWIAYYKALSAYKIDSSKFTGRPKPPSYVDDKNLVKFNNQAIGKREFGKGCIVPSMSPIRIPVKPGLKLQDLCEVRIIPKTGYFVIEVVYEIPETSDFFCSLNPGLNAAIDIGLDNLATIVFNDLEIQPIIVNGKPLKSVNQFYNKQVAFFRSVLPKVQGKSRRIANIVRNRNNFLDSYLHQSTKMIVDEFLRLGVTHVSIGKNEQWKTHLNLGKRTNQNFTQIPHAKFIEILTYKLQRVGITVKVAEESYTSKASAIDWDIIPIHEPNNKIKHIFSGRRVKRAWYVSKDGFKIHADVNAGLNIGRKSNPEGFDCLKSILRDRGCLVVHPRRITPLFKRVHA